MLGQGGSGSVFEATDEQGASVAIKFLDPLKATQEKRKRFKNEILFGQIDRHPGIIRVLDFGVSEEEAGESLFYVMPLFPQTLRDYMHSQRDHESAMRLFGKLLDAVEAAHLLRVVHRDLKPENVLLNKKSDTLVVADFGVAHFEQEELYTLVETKPQTRLANFLYAAPEQRLRGRPVGSTADIYALGLILHELFTGEVPQGTSYTMIASVAPRYSYLDPVVSSMIRQKPEERPPNIDVVKQQLISHRNDFISRQRLSEITKTVVTDSELDDPLVSDPIKLVDVRMDHDSTPHLVLSRAPNQTWLAMFRDMSGVSFFMGLDFRRFPIQGTAIRLPRDQPNLYQELITQVKAGIDATNRMYRGYAEQEKVNAREAERRRLQEAAHAERAAMEMRAKLRELQI